MKDIGLQQLQIKVLVKNSFLFYSDYEDKQ